MSATRLAKGTPVRIVPGTLADHTDCWRVTCALEHEVQALREEVARLRSEQVLLRLQAGEPYEAVDTEWE